MQSDQMAGNAALALGVAGLAAYFPESFLEFCAPDAEGFVPYHCARVGLGSRLLGASEGHRLEALGENMVVEDKEEPAELGASPLDHDAPEGASTPDPPEGPETPPVLPKLGSSAGGKHSD